MLWKYHIDKNKDKFEAATLITQYINSRVENAENLLEEGACECSEESEELLSSSSEEVEDVSSSGSKEDERDKDDEVTSSSSKTKPMNKVSQPSTFSTQKQE